VDEDAHPKTKLTVGQAIWLDLAEHEDTTRECYNDLIRLYVVPTPGNLPAVKLDAELLERFYAGCTAAASFAPAGLARATPAARWAPAPRGRSTTSSAAPSSARSAGGTVGV